MVREQVITVYHQLEGMERPKRGDLLQSNVGDRRERTWMILQTREMPTKFCKEIERVAIRTKVWAERWWEIEPETRMRLFRSAERNGGQQVHLFYRFKVEKRRPRVRFEEW